MKYMYLKIVSLVGLKTQFFYYPKDGSEHLWGKCLLPVQLIW